jgi:hypothetical protein
MQEAMARPDARRRRTACATELDGMLEKWVFELVERRKETPVFKSRWVFTDKPGPDGSMTRYKARFVTKGFVQMPGRIPELDAVTSVIMGNPTDFMCTRS